MNQAAAYLVKTRMLSTSGRKWKFLMGQRQGGGTRKFRADYLHQENLPSLRGRQGISSWRLPHQYCPGNSRLTGLKFHLWERLELPLGEVFSVGRT